MASRRAELIGHLPPENAGMDGGRIRLKRNIEQTGVGVPVLAERDHARRNGFGRAPEPWVLRIVPVEHRGAARLQPKKNLRLGVRDRLERAEIFEMNRLD